MTPFDLTKIRKNLTKSIEGLSFGFTQPTTWFSSGNYALNWLLTKDFEKAFPLDGRINMCVGDSASGKSYICSGNVVKDALSKNVPVILFDTEDRLDENWMKNLGVDANSPLLQRIQTNSIENIMKCVSMICKQYKDDNADVPFDEQSGLLFIIDSIGALYSSDEMERYNDGQLSMTDGMRRAGAITRMMNSILSNIASTKMGCLITNHVYASTDMYSDDVIPGGKKLIYLATQILQMNKLKLKAKDLENAIDDVKDSDVVGIRSKCKVYKSNWNRAFTSVEVQIPYETGMDKTSGLFDLFTDGIKVESKPLLQKEGNQYSYYSLNTGEQVFKKFRKNITADDYELIMKEYTEYSNKEDKTK